MLPVIIAHGCIDCNYVLEVHNKNLGRILVPR